MFRNSSKIKYNSFLKTSMNIFYQVDAFTQFCGTLLKCHTYLIDWIIILIFFSLFLYKSTNFEITGAELFVHYALTSICKLHMCWKQFRNLPLNVKKFSNVFNFSFQQVIPLSLFIFVNDKHKINNYWVRFIH